MSIKDDVKVNRFRLDEECEKHAGLYHGWAEQLADAKDAVNTADDRLKFILAERELIIRKNLEIEGAKTTEGMVKAKLETDQEVLDAREACREAAKNQYHLEAATKSMEHRKSELDNLVTLYAKAYFSRPEGRNGVTEQVGDDVRKNLNRGKA